LKETGMANQQSSDRRWPLAVLVSILLHGAVLLGFSLVSARQVTGARAGSSPACVSFACLKDDDDGEVRFVGAPAAVAAAAPVYEHQSTTPTPAPEIVATLRDPWATAPSEASSTARTAGEPSGSGMGAAAGSFFRAPLSGQRLVYILDGSMSMGKRNALARAGRELVASLKQLPVAAHFQVIIYNHQPQYLLPRSFRSWLTPTPAVLDEVATALVVRTAEGGTDHELALAEAFCLNPCPDTIFLLTDADDLRPEHVRRLNALNRSRAVIHTIELNTRNRGRPDMPLQRMAADNRGMYEAVELER
jgi:hypothetical protein